MLNDKQLNILANNSYQYDSELESHPTRPGKINAKGNYQVLNDGTVDNDQNGMQAVAVAPLDANGKPDYSNITISFAGTGASASGKGQDPKDIVQDVEGFGTGSRDTLYLPGIASSAGLIAPTINSVDSQFKTALEFYDKIHKKYPNAKINVTGHSLGGGIALFVASHYHLQAHVYSAPDPWHLMNTQERLWSLAHPEMLLNYRHHGDLWSETDSRIVEVDGFTGTSIWCKSTKEGSPHQTHGLDTFEFGKHGKVKIKGQMKEDSKLATRQITALSVLINDLKKSDGKMTNAEKIAVDSVGAISVSESLSRIACDGIEGIKQIYYKNIDDLSTLWDQVVSGAQTIGEHLSSSEVLAALTRGGVTHEIMVEVPVEKMRAKIKLCDTVKTEYAELSEKISNTVQKKIASDKELSVMFK